MTEPVSKPGPDETGQRSSGPRAEQPGKTGGQIMRVCPNCSTELQEVRCKLSCPRCGFFLSCSDYY
jgi:hypothetical protein